MITQYVFFNYKPSLRNKFSVLTKTFTKQIGTLLCLASLLCGSLWPLSSSAKEWLDVDEKTSMQALFAELITDFFWY